MKMFYNMKFKYNEKIVEVGIIKDKPHDAVKDGLKEVEQKLKLEFNYSGDVEKDVALIQLNGYKIDRD